MSVYHDLQAPAQRMRRADDIDKAVASALKSQRRAIGMSQRELADAIGVSYQQIQKYEAGTNRISAGRLFIITRCIGLEVADLFASIIESDDLEIAETPLQRRINDIDNLQDPALRQAFKGLIGALVTNQCEGEEEN